MTRHEEQQALNLEHIIRPQPGDYWHEMFCPTALVIWRDGEHVEFLTWEHVKRVDADHWTWDVDKPAVRMTYDEFAVYMRYKSPALAHKTVSDVVPDRCREHVQAALETRKRIAP